MQRGLFFHCHMANTKLSIRLIKHHLDIHIANKDTHTIHIGDGKYAYCMNIFITYIFFEKTKPIDD